MSDDSNDSSMESSSTPNSTPEKRRSTVPDILPHQRSFEKRYSHMIHKQILETGVNKEALQRQINAYFSCGGGGGGAAASSSAPPDVAKEDANENATPPPSPPTGAEVYRKSLDKAETLDIAELQETQLGAAGGEL